VAESEGLSLVKESKTTTRDAAEAALDAYPEPVHLIAGRRGKRTSFAALARAARGPVERAYLIGETAGDLAAALDAEGVAHEAPGTLEAAVAAAASPARPGAAGRRAPAWAGSDQFREFEERGAAFRAAVEALLGERAGRTGSGVAPAK